MTTLSHMILRAKSAPKHIVLAEGHDPRIIEAAVKAVQDKLAAITLLGEHSELRPLLRAAGDSQDDVAILTPTEAKETQAYAESYHALRQHKVLRLSEARQAVEAPLNFANMMVRQGAADGSVAGAINTTPDVVRSALQIIGVDQRYDLVSSLFVMIMPKHSEILKGGMIYSDCGLVINPDASQLADIASAAANNAKMLLGLEPKVAMLSFSTHGSANHPFVDKVEAATQILRENRPDLSVDGELQFDAAMVPEIAKLKAPNSKTAGQANVFIFPDLNAGNIGYKITQRLGGAKAIGPILQGLAKPANDLSRGCTADDVLNMIVITALQAQALDMHKAAD